VHFWGTYEKRSAAQCQIPIFSAGETRFSSEGQSKPGENRCGGGQSKPGENGLFVQGMQGETQVVQFLGTCGANNLKITRACI